MLAFAGAVAMGDGGQDGGGGVEAGQHVGQRHADLLRPGAGLGVAAAGDRHQPAHALDQEIVAGPGRVGAGLAEAGDGAIDQAGVDGAQAVVVEPVRLEAAHLEILDDDVAVGSQAVDQVLAAGLGEVDRDAALVAVGAQEVGGVVGGLAGRVGASRVGPSRGCRHRCRGARSSPPRRRNSPSSWAAQGPARIRDRSRTLRWARAVRLFIGRVMGRLPGWPPLPGCAGARAAGRRWRTRHRR